MFLADLSFLTLVQDFYLVFTLFSYYLFTHFLLITSGFALIISLYVIYFSFYFLILYYLSSALSLPLVYFNMANAGYESLREGMQALPLTGSWSVCSPLQSACLLLSLRGQVVLSLTPLSPYSPIKKTGLYLVKAQFLGGNKAEITLELFSADTLHSSFLLDSNNLQIVYRFVNKQYVLFTLP